MINKLYLRKENIKQIKKILYSSNNLNSIELPNFLDGPYYDALRKRIISLKYKSYIDPLNFKYSMANVPAALINDPNLLAFVSLVFGKKINHIDAYSYKLRWKDYTILNDDSLEKAGVDVIFDLTENWDEKNGGVVVYADGTGEYFTLPPRKNSMFIVRRKRNVHKFIKYLNHYSKERYLIIGTLRPWA